MKKVLLLSVFLLVLMAFSGQVNALTITPGSGILDTSRWEGVYDGITNWKDALAAAGIDFEENQIEAGDTTASIAGGDYDVSWVGSSGDESGVTVSFSSGTATTFEYLFVKDGNHNPAWYLFDLSQIAPAWDITVESLVLEDFWPNGGAISHISLHGGETSVPEPSTMFLLGFGLVGLVGVTKKVKK